MLLTYSCFFHVCIYFTSFISVVHFLPVRLALNGYNVRLVCQRFDAFTI